MTLRPAFSLLALFVLSGCGPSARPGDVELLQPALLAHWHAAGIAEGGKVSIQAGELILFPGKPMSGAFFDGWIDEKLPLTDYAIAFEARRVEGRDFFAALTFPVRRIDTCATLVLGGWGGALVGVSSIDDQDASENSTRSEQHFTNSQWYRVRLEITNDELKAWLDDRLVVNTSIKGRKISLRPGDIEHCAPFGFASFASEGQVRGLKITRL